MSDDKPKIVLLKEHKNGFIPLMRDANLSPERFQVQETMPDHCAHFVLILLGTPFRFTTRMNYENYDEFDCQYVRFAPGFPLSPWYPESTSWSHIDDIYDMFSSWLEEHIERFFMEADAPDLWSQIQSQTPVVSDEPVGSDDREPFTQPEQVQLRMAIKEFRQVIIEKHAPNDEQQKLIDNRLEYLSEQLPQLNRINWRSVALTTLIAIVIQLTLSTEQGKVLFEMGQRILSNIVPLLPE